VFWYVCKRESYNKWEHVFGRVRHKNVAQQIGVRAWVGECLGLGMCVGRVTCNGCYICTVYKDNIFSTYK